MGIDYRCTACNKQTPKADLAAKTVTFRELGYSKPLIRSRTVAWLCKSCMGLDPDFNLERTDGPDATHRREKDSATSRRS